MENWEEQDWRQHQNNQFRDIREGSPFTQQHATHVVGFESQGKELINCLVEGKEDCTVISVVGMAGLGKTSLAKTLYFNPDVIDHIDCRVWITVSDIYTVEGLLKDVLRFGKYRNKQAPVGIWEMNRDELVNEVREYLQGHRYVIFFDDVWNPNFWERIQFTFVDEKIGSRILITTRDMRVASSCRRSSSRVHVHEMQTLTLEKSLELFYEKALLFDFNKPCLETLEPIFCNIVKDCSCLPLAIMVIGSLLRTKDKTAFDWTKFSQNLSLALQYNDKLKVIPMVISLSYHDLPFFLKPCLLYFGMYPKSREVKLKRLIRQWIAEGFVQQGEEGNSLEKVAELYLTELINRSLVQVSSVGIDGKVKGCRVNDLIHDMILSIAKDSSFCQCIGEDDLPFSNGKSTSRRLSLKTISNDLMASTEGPSTRSLHFSIGKEVPEHLLRLILSKYKLLKVLDFESARPQDVPENLGDLILLKYLSFKDTGIQNLPKSIGKLHNLETLDLRQTAMAEIPNEVTKLRKLQHLLGSRMSWTQLKDGIGGMVSLQTLSGVQIDDDAKEPIRELGKLTKMRKLSLIGVREEQVSDLCSSINEMQNLERLNIDVESKDAAVDLHFISFPPCLQKLSLQAKLTKLPESIPELHNLVELSLSHSMLTDDPLQSLKDLPNLLRLNLVMDSYEGERLHFQEGGFQKLKKLGLRYFHKLDSMVIDKDALRSLKELLLMSIPKLKKAPEGIQHLAKLEVLNMYLMPTEFEQSMAELTKDMNLRK